MKLSRHLAAEGARQGAHRAAQELACDARVKLVYLFGSAADPARDLVRDVDLAILTDPALSAGELMRLRADVAAHGPRADRSRIAQSTPRIVPWRTKWRPRGSASTHAIPTWRPSSSSGRTLTIGISNRFWKSNGA